MKNRNIKILCLLLVLQLLLSLVGCGSSPVTIMDNGADDFASGKSDQSYAIKSSGDLLDELIDKYSGGYTPPVPVQVTPSPTPVPTPAPSADPDDPQPTADPGEPQPTTPPEEPDENEVGSYDELKMLFYRFYAASETSISFTLVNGFSFDPSVDLNDIYHDLQREFPIDVACLKTWYYSSSGNRYSVSVDYTMPVDELKQIKADTPALVKAAVSQIDTTGLTEYEIVLAVNDYLCNTVYYPPQKPYAPITHTVYGALHDGCAVCEGYACAAKVLLNELGVVSDIEVGTCTGGGGHAWNLVKVDGSWYQLDITWNDGGSDRMDYFLITDNDMLKSRTWEFSKYPSTPSVRYSPN